MSKLRPRPMVFGAFLSALILILTAAALPAKADYDPYLSQPGRVPDLDITHTPILEPGEGGDITITITNRYGEAINNAIFEFEIYGVGDVDFYKDIGQVDSPPEFVGASEALHQVVGGTRIIVNYQTMVPNVAYPLTLSVRSKSDTTVGTYFVRTMATFDYKDNTSIVMMSRGHFSDEDWDHAVQNVPDGYPGLNLTHLQITGLTPDTSFAVKKPIPRWPYYVLVVAAVILAVLAVLFYLMDEKGKFPELKKKLDGRKGEEGK